MDQERLQNETIAGWASSPERAYLDLQRCVHSIAGCPAQILPKNLEEAKALAESCSLGRRYVETEEPSFLVPREVYLLINNVGYTLVRNDILGGEDVRPFVNFLGSASGWPLVSAREAAIFVALHLITGMGEVDLSIENPIFMKRQLVIMQLIDSCIFGRIQQDTVNPRVVRPPLMQIRDRVLRIRQLIVNVVKRWLKYKPELFFPLCHKMLAYIICDQVGLFAYAGMEILRDLLPRFSETEGTFIVTLSFMSNIKQALVFRIRNATPSNKIRVIATMIIEDFVKSRSSYGESPQTMGEWIELCRALQIMHV